MAREGKLERAQWGSRIGFVLAAMGSAIGFGSIARFPMNVANGGGAVFILLYAAIMVLIGVPMMIAEFSLGRAAQKNTVGTLVHQTEEPRTKWRLAGHLYWLVAAFFLSWYAVVSGWVLRYFFASMTGAYFEDPDAYISDAREGPDALFWHFAVIALTGAVVVFQISKGIEKLNLVLMPALFAIVVGLAIYAATLADSSPGYTFYLEPDFNAVTLGVVTAAVGQAFFSLSLFEGAMMTYASYLPKKASLAGNSLMIALSTLGFAFTCGLMIFPMLSSFGLLGGEEAGLDLIFGPLSRAFAQMGEPTGNIVGSLFFLGTFFAAFTSAVSLTEPGIAYFVEEKGIDRRRAAIIVCLGIYAAGIIAAFSVDILQLEGGAFTDMFVILGGLLLALFVGYRISEAKARAQMDECDKGFKLSFYAYPLAKYVMPIVLAVLLFFSVAGTPCALSGNEDSVGVIESIFPSLNPLGCDPPLAALSP